MPFLRNLIVALLLAVLPVTAQARELTDDETAAIVALIDGFNAAMSGNDYEAVSEVVPPAVLSKIATDAGLTMEQLRQAMLDQMKWTMEQVTLVSFEMDIAKAEHRELADGSPYLVIPTITVIDAGDGSKSRASSPTLVLSDGGSWYLMRIGDDQQLALLRAVYPQYADVEFPASTMEAVE